MQKAQFNSFEEARQSVQGTKYKVANVYKKFIGSGIDMEDLLAAADIGIWEAYKTWDPEKAAFNTHAHNHIEFKIKDELNEMNHMFRVNQLTTYDLSTQNESYKTIKERGLTLNAEFNAEHGLDGSDEAKRKVNRDLFNHYVTWNSSLKNPVFMLNESSFTSSENEDFNIFETVGVHDNHDRIDMEIDIDKLAPTERMIAKMLLEGSDISEVAKKLKTSKVALLKKYAPREKFFEND